MTQSTSVPPGAPERTLAEALEESENRLRLLVRAVGMGQWSWDVLGNVVQWDQAMCGIFGVAQAPASYEGYLALVHPEDRERMVRVIRNALETGVYEDVEHRLAAQPGLPVRWIMCRGATTRDAQGRLVKLYGGCIDVTEQRLFEERLRQAQKMDAIGQLTAGIAHNFNNMLTGILPSVELAMRDATPRSRGLLENARDAATSAAHMVRQLLVFAGAGGQNESRPENMGTLVARTVDFFGRMLDRRVSLTLEVDVGVSLVCVHAAQLEQALLNVLINARDALEPVSDRAPRIHVHVQLLDPGAPELLAFSARADTRYVAIRVEDNGVGMSEAVREHMFEPFFTTKDVGRGTGLGLATAYGVLRDHHGFIDCSSVPGLGTTFTLALPAYEGAERAVPALDDDLVVAPVPATVLLVDDEEVVVSAVEAILCEAGYRVLIARDGRQAIRVFGEQPGAIDVVLLDQALPGASGASVLSELRRQKSSVRVISFSGYNVRPDGFDGVIDKPVNARRLLQTVREILEA